MESKLRDIFTPAVAVIYYGIIAVAVLFWSDGSIPGIMRYPLVTAIFLPAIFVDSRWMLPSLVTTTMVFINLPGNQFQMQHWYYITVILIVVLLNAKEKGRITRPLEMLPFMCLLVYMVAIDLIYGNNFTAVHKNILMALCAALLIGEDGHQAKETLPYAFIIGSLLISIAYWMNVEDYLFQYNRDNLTRSFWTDPNYQGSTIGIGTMLAVYLLVNGKAENLWQKVLCVATVAISLITLFALASRGAMLAVAVTIVMLVIFSGKSNGVKIITFVLCSAIVIYAYTQSYMDLFIYRMHERTLMTGAKRFIVWQDKWDYFLRDRNLLHWLFGIGKDASFQLGTIGVVKGFAMNNQLLASLLNYGIVGLAALLALFWLPIKKAAKGNKMSTALLVLYPCIVFLTLEPLTIGFATFYFLYLYIYIQATR